jgi:hypothetical protein
MRTRNQPISERLTRTQTELRRRRFRMFQHFFFVPSHFNLVWKVTGVPLLSNGPQAFWCHQKKNGFAECEPVMHRFFISSSSANRRPPRTPSGGSNGLYAGWQRTYISAHEVFAWYVWAVVCGRARGIHLPMIFLVVLCVWQALVYFVTCQNTLHLLLSLRIMALACSCLSSLAVHWRPDSYTCPAFLSAPYTQRFAGRPRDR